MIFLYTSLIFALGAVAFLVRRRVKSLENKYAHAAKETDALLKQTVYKDGNSSRADPCVAAMRQLQLGLMVQRRDRVESRYVAWQSLAERVNRWVTNLRAWKGKKLPYTFGAVDVACLLGTIDYLGFGEVVGPRPMIQYVLHLFGG